MVYALRWPIVDLLRALLSWVLIPLAVLSWPIAYAVDHRLSLRKYLSLLDNNLRFVLQRSLLMKPNNAWLGRDRDAEAGSLDLDLF